MTQIIVAKPAQKRKPQFCSLLFFCPKLLFRRVTPFTIISFLVKVEAKVSDLLVEGIKNSYKVLSRPRPLTSISSLQVSQSDT